MLHSSEVEVLRSLLLKEVGRLYRRDDRRWKMPVTEMLHSLQCLDNQAVFFGGTLRSLLVSRYYCNKPGRPRDIDIVISGSSIESLRKNFEDKIARETRFGGLQIRNDQWQFDVWPLGQTWAFVRDDVESPDFSALPSTTFFNLEAIAVEVWARPGKQRVVFSGDDQFFNGILTRTIEINRRENPFPELCVVRALVMANALNFKIGPGLAGYIAEHGGDITTDTLEYIQIKHYGDQRMVPENMQQLIQYITSAYYSDCKSAVNLPETQQLALFDDGF